VVEKLFRGVIQFIGLAVRFLLLQQVQQAEQISGRLQLLTAAQLTLAHLLLKTLDKIHGT
jgi:hypothetical protein